MRFLSKLVRIWAWLGIITVLGVLAFLFAYVYHRGSHVLSWTFLTQSPSGAVLGEEGGIYPAIIGSLWFTGTAILLGSIPAIGTALYLVYYCHSEKRALVLRLTIQCMAGVPSIVLGLFAYSFLVKTLGWGRCILSSGVALGIMILPFIEVRAEKAFQEFPASLVQASQALGVSKTYLIIHMVLPACRGELVQGIVLGGCYAMGATAPLLFTGAVAYASVPDSFFKPAMALPMHLYLLIAQGATSIDLAYGTAFVMMAIILFTNLAAVLYARRRHHIWKQS